MDYQKLLSAKVQGIKPSGIRKFFDLASEMQDVISLGVGEPDFKTPWTIREAGIDSLKQGATFYTSNAGLKELRQEISNYQKRRFGLEYNHTDEIIVTVGGSEAIDIALRALINPGDEVLVPDPTFVCYAPLAEIMGAKVVPVVTKPENSFRITPEDILPLITPKTKALVFPFPSNPTGAVMRRADLEKIAAVLRGTDIIVISDEIYAELTYGGERHVSIASLDGMRERTIVVGGFSKAYAMTGWRLGYVMAPAPLMTEMHKIHQLALMCASTVSQYAAIAALKYCDEDIEMMAREYNRRRGLVVSRLNKMGLSCFNPEGAFYVFPCVGSTGLSSEEFCERLLKSQKVAIVPGGAFGEAGEGFARICYAYSLEHITTALDRIEAFLKTL